MIRLRADNVLISLDHLDERRGAERVLPSGLIVPRAAGPRPIDAVVGTVLAVGPGRHVDRCPVHAGHHVPVSVRVGDRVLADSATCGQPVQVDGRECRIVREDELHAVLG